MQTVTLDVLDLLPCLIWEPLVESHSNKTRVWKRRGHLGETMLRAALHIFTVNEWMLRVLWRRNKGCLRQELHVFVVYLNPVGKKPVCEQWPVGIGQAVHLLWAHHMDCYGVLSTHLGGKDLSHSANGHAPVGLEGGFISFFFKISFAPCRYTELLALFSLHLQTSEATAAAIVLWGDPWLLSLPVCDHGGSVCAWARSSPSHCIHSVFPADKLCEGGRT